MVLTEKQISERTVYNGLIVNVKLDKVELPDGRQVPREVVEHPGGVTIVPVYENNDVAVVTQYRYPFSKFSNKSVLFILVLAAEICTYSPVVLSFNITSGITCSEETPS